MGELAFQRCIHPHCFATVEPENTAFSCPKCDGLLDVTYDWARLPIPKTLTQWKTNRDISGVWRFRDLFPFANENQILSIGEGQTLCRPADRVARYAGLNPGRLFLQYEGLNPSGSFKDNGMTAAFTHASMIGAKRAACASTGNTSASLALYAAATGALRGIVFIGSGKISRGKLSQALEHGALTLQIEGDFDDALRQVRDAAQHLRLYLVNSVNPFRLEGQKTIIYRVLEALNWEVPEWIVVPGGNLGNTAAFGKALSELNELGLIRTLPRLAVINAVGANTFFQLYETRKIRWNGGRPDRNMIDSHYSTVGKAQTLASAIEINRPVNLPKALRALECCGGCVRQVTDPEILDAKAQIGTGGLGCEPASAASVAGLKQLVADGVIGRDERVVCILTGHLLKDPEATVNYHSGAAISKFANQAIRVPNNLKAIIAAVESNSSPSSEPGQ